LNETKKEEFLNFGAINEKDLQVKPFRLKGFLKGGKDNKDFFCLINHGAL